MPCVIKAHGARYELDDPGGIIGNCLRSGSPYERKVLERIHRFALSGTAIDAGAGVGNHTLWMAAVCGLHVEAFEPLDYHRLVANLALNPGVDAVAHPAALGDRDRPGRVTPAPEHVTGRALTEADEVAILRLDDFGFDPVLIKIDVEGMEPEVLRGARKTINRSHPLLYVEAVDDAAAARNVAEIPRGYVRTGVYGATPLEEWTWSR